MKIAELKRDDLHNENGLLFDNGNRLFDYHERDCCESVYADWSVLNDYNTLGKDANKTAYDVEFNEDILANIELVKGEGFKLRYTDGDHIGSVFIPCHNSQNGYYSSALALIYRRNRGDIRVEEQVSISQCCKDNIY